MTQSPDWTPADRLAVLKLVEVAFQCGRQGTIRMDPRENLGFYGPDQGPVAARVNDVLERFGRLRLAEANLGEEYLAVLARVEDLEAAVNRRPAEPEDVANAILLLASPLAGYVSGTVLAVDGGSGACRVGVRPVAI